jgi:hypothetical protein
MSDVKNICDSIDFDNENVPKVVMYHKERKKELDKHQSLEFIGESHVNKNYLIYKVTSPGIPQYYEEVKSVEELIGQKFNYQNKDKDC